MTTISDNRDGRRYDKIYYFTDTHRLEASLGLLLIILRNLEANLELKGFGRPNLGICRPVWCVKKPAQCLGCKDSSFSIQKLPYDIHILIWGIHMMVVVAWAVVLR